MKITRELLEHFQVCSILVSDLDGKEHLAYFEKYENKCWSLYIPDKITPVHEELLLQINFRNDKNIVFTAAVIEYSDNLCTLRIPESIDNVQFQDMIQSLYDIEYTDKLYGRRKEPRLKIGKEKYLEFGLETIQQQVVYNGTSLCQPCVIIDASVHGICLMTPYIPEETYDFFFVRIKFTDPDQDITLQLHKVNIRVTDTDGCCIATVSCQILEPIHFVWRNRVYSLLRQSTQFEQ